MSEKFAIPKKGRVYEMVQSLLKDAGLVLKRRGRLDMCVCEALGIEVYFLPAKDIPGAVASGAIHYGITGIDLIKDSGADVDSHLDLGIGRARMVLASPEKNPYDGPESLEGKKIGSSYPRLAKQFLESLKVKDYEIVQFAGAVEIQVKLGVVDAIVEIVETGSTLVANNLLVREKFLESEMVLISTKNHKTDLLDLLVKRLQRVIRGRSHVLLKFNLPSKLLEEACSLSEGMSSPTVNHLKNSDWIALEVAILKSEMHTLIDELHDLGAQGILAIQLTHCAPDQI